LARTHNRNAIGFQYHRRCSGIRYQYAHREINRQCKDGHQRSVEIQAPGHGMRIAVALGLIFFGSIHFEIAAQDNAAAAKSPAAAAGKKQKNESNNLLNAAGQSNEPTTTEIYADEAFFDSNKNMGIFSGHVKVVDPRFNLQSEKLTVFVSKGQNQGLEK